MVLANFAFLILEIYPEVVTNEDNEELLALEDKYLNMLKPAYNILTKAGSSFGYKHTEEDRQKMSDNYSQDRRDRIGALNKGKTLSDEVKALIQKAALARHR